ncbi:hypothetical protein [Sphingobacterium hungaricum]|nr:hypothetical protein [Sphingobacterium hungaricum]
MSLPFVVQAQELIQGIVFDKETKQRIGKVIITNLNQQTEFYNNVRGEFKISPNPGDVLVASRDGFNSDTVVFDQQSVILFNLKRSIIYISEVNVVARKSPEEILKQEKESFNKAYRLADPGSLFSVGQTGAGLSISSIYNLLSKEGRNARRLTEIIERNYQENFVDYRFSPDLVNNITGLEGDMLRRFMSNYRPSYEFTRAANQYELSQYIKSKYILFKLNPNLRHLPALPVIKMDVNN